MQTLTPSSMRSTALRAPHLQAFIRQRGSRPIGHRSRRVATCAQNIRARWLIDIRYGVKLDAVALLQEWVADIGAQAGLTPFNTSINSGAVGVPESRLELEVAFDSMAELESFWAAIPPDCHRAWSQRAQHLIVDGSPTWHVFRTCAPLPPASNESATAAQAPAPPPLLGRQRGLPRPQLPFAAGPDISGLDAANPQPPDAAEEAPVALDWKGDPMKINPGDKMPFF